jgi:hypothetical protein
MTKVVKKYCWNFCVDLKTFMDLLVDCVNNNKPLPKFVVRQFVQKLSEDWIIKNKNTGETVACEIYYDNGDKK